ncbi:MAG: NUDIX hydrolase [Candidatus Peribacteria bacterium]|jgi:8-oxo-dGTP diphosphatase|nr:NUDIX hydrolase [Candidatus Peribacteria bacterium]
MSQTIKQNILITVDNVIFTIINDKLHVLLVKREIEPFKDSWTIPGGFVLEEENLEKAAYRELEEKTSVKNIYLEQLYTFSDPKRDPRGRVISVAYMALVTRENVIVKAGSYTSEAKFFPVEKLPKLGFDHKKIISYAEKRLKWKLEYTNVAQYILPTKFTLSQLQKVYETVFEQKFDVRNFRKKIDKLGIVKETGEKERGNQYRPARLFQFVNKEIEIIDMI